MVVNDIETCRLNNTALLQPGCWVHTRTVNVPVMYSIPLSDKTVQAIIVVITWAEHPSHIIEKQLMFIVIKCCWPCMYSQFGQLMRIMGCMAHSGLNNKNCTRTWDQ